MSHSRKAPPLPPGSELFVRPRESDRSALTAARVESCEDGLVWLEGSCAPLEVGDVAVVESPVTGDARYVAMATVAFAWPSRFALRISEQWERSQQREFVRIITFNQQLEIDRVVMVTRAPRAAARGRAGRRAPAEASAGTLRLEMLDLSAGGLRFSSAEPFDLQEEVRCRFALPDAGEFDLLARVVRLERKKPGYVGRRWYSVEFQQPGNAERSALVRWAFQEQLRRHRAFKSRP